MDADPPQPPQSPAAAFLAGCVAACRSVMTLVLIGTYIGMAALAHDFGVGVWWMVASTVLVWAGPAQVILISALPLGAAPLEVAVAVSLSSVRLLPLVMSLLPLLREPGTPTHKLILPAHLTAVSMWVESLRLLPALPRQNRLAFANGLGLTFMMTAQVGTFLGFYLANSLPPLLTAAMLFITPMSFLISTTRNCRLLLDWTALALGLVIGPLLAWKEVGLDIVWTGLGAGTAAYLAHRLREALR
jgi:predicted branched-subunit amino acid permease